MANGEYALSFDKLSVDMNRWTGNTPWNTHISSLSSSDVRSNDDWSLQLFRYQSTYGLYMGRISGAYQGGGFIIELSKTPHIICAERIQNGIIYKKTPGSYCEKLFKATPLADAGTYRRYQMP